MPVDKEGMAEPMHLLAGSPKLMLMDVLWCMNFLEFSCTITCRWATEDAGGRGCTEEGMGEQPAQHQGRLGGVDAPVRGGAAAGVPLPCPQGDPPAGPGSFSPTSLTILHVCAFTAEI